VDKRAAEQYLAKVFGNTRGYVAVAYKGKDGSWEETQFSWPRQKPQLLEWAEKCNPTGNVFICPALRNDPNTRKKGDAADCKWLWADVDWQAVPAQKVAEVRKRIAELCSMGVLSGTDDNVHVYVELSDPVSAADHTKLNTGLRDYLYADNKQADNSLLRLPGTTNWKTGAGSPVKLGGRSGKVTTAQSLMKLRAFRDAKVIVDPEATEWSFVEIEGLSRRLLAKTRMTAGEAKTRYKKRHQAVWAITGDLHKAGLNADEIHSLMHHFPPAISKAAEENGYDVHRDVDKRLSHERDTGQEVFSELTPEQQEEEEHQQFQADVDKGIYSERVRDAVKMQRAVSRHSEPSDHLSESFTDALSNPPDPVQWLIEGLATPEANVIITGQYKSGKTAIMVASLISALADGHDFLGRFPVHTPDGKGVVVGHWNLEMGRTDLLDKYMRNAGIKNTDNVKLAHWRGQNVNIRTEPGKNTAVHWLKTRGVQVWTIDSWAQLARMAGINTNDNDECYELLGAIDEIKLRAGVGACFMLGHTGRNSDEKTSSTGGLNPTRGASAVDEHVDARWVLTRDSADIRYLAVEGRDVDIMKATSLEFDEATKRSVMGNQSRSEVAADGLVQEVVRVLQSMGDRGLNQGDLVKRVRANVSIGATHCRQVIEEAEVGGYIEIRTEQRSAGGRASRMHYLAGGKPEGDRARKATPREVNMARARNRDVSK
jgi:hypothetical protein